MSDNIKREWTKEEIIRFFEAYEHSASNQALAEFLAECSRVWTYQEEHSDDYWKYGVY